MPAQSHEAVKATLQTFQQTLGDELIAFYLYGSMTQSHYVLGRSDINMLAIVGENVDFYKLREAFLPVWWRYRTVMHRPPLVARQHAFVRHLQLFPTLASHLAKQGKRLFGDVSQTKLPRLTVPDAMAQLIAEVVEGSQALTPNLLPTADADKPRWLLYRLARRLGIDVSGTTGPPHLFALIEQKLQTALDKLPNSWQPKISPDAPPLLPNLQAIYIRGESLIFVLPALTHAEILNTDWHAVSALVEKQCDGLQLVTPQQFQLMIEYVYPLEHLLTAFTLDWGADVLADVNIDRRFIMRSAGRLPSTTEVETLIGRFLTCEEAEMGMLVHDFQNKLLNIQLRHELLVRYKHAPLTGPPDPLPDRSEMPARRIDAIFRHFNWWANYYTNRMLNYDR